jgi:hypothetical protein
MNAGVSVHPSVEALALTDEECKLTDRSGASVADLASIELRRITDVLQVDHASLFVPDPYDPARATMVASVGARVEDALPAHAGVIARVLATGRVQQLHHVHGDPRGARSALATPLLDDERPVGALLVVTLRETRRLGLFETQLIGRATETLIARVLVPRSRSERHTASERFVRGPESRR